MLIVNFKKKFSSLLIFYTHINIWTCRLGHRYIFGLTPGQRSKCILHWFRLTTRRIMERRGRCRHHVSSSSSSFSFSFFLARIQVKSRFFFSFLSSSFTPWITECIYMVVLLLHRAYNNSRSFSLYIVVKGCCVLLTFCSSLPYNHVMSTREQTQREWKIDFLFSYSLSFSLVAFGACFCCLQKWPNHSSFRCVKIRAAQAHSPSPTHAPERLTTKFNIKRSNSTNEYK